MDLILPENDLRPSNALLGAFDASSWRRLRLLLEVRGIAVQPCATMEQLVRRAANHPGAFDLVIIYVEDFGGPGRIYDLLTLLREAAPELPVILVSDRLKADDLTLERLAIADVCLRDPPQDAALDDAIATAVANNRVWQGRRAERVAEMRALVRATRPLHKPRPKRATRRARTARPPS